MSNFFPPNQGGNDGMPIAPAGNLSFAEGSNWVPTSGTQTTLYQWDSDITATDPGTGKLKANNADLSLITEIYVSNTSQNGADFNAVFNKLVSGNVVYSANSEDTTTFALGEVDGTVIDNGSWFTIPMTIDSSNNAYSGGTKVTISLVPFLTDSQIKTQYENNANTNAFTDAEQSKLGSLTGGRYLGVFADLTALQSAHPTAVSGDTATVTSPDGNLFYWNGGAWADSGTGFAGDMLKAVYDPTAKNADAFNMDNMAETATNKILTAAERDKLSGIEALAEVNNISDANAADLTDGGETSLHTHAPSNVYGTERVEVISLADASTSNKFSDNPAIRATLVTGALPVGTYRLVCNFAFMMTKDRKFRAALWNGVEYLKDEINYKSDESSDRLAQTIVTQDLILSGVNTFDLHYGSDMSGDTATIGDLTIEFIRVA